MTHSLYSVPDKWCDLRLKEIATIIMGQSPPSSTYNESGEGLSFLQGKAEFGLIYPRPQKYTTKPLKIAEKGDILIAVRAPVGDVNIAPYRIAIGRGLAAIRPRTSKVDTFYLFYYLQFIKPYLEHLGKGSTFKAITKRDLENLTIVLPPLDEQRRIAKILSTVDEAIAKTDAIISRIEDLRRALLDYLMTHGIEHREYRETEIGKIPKEWKIAKLKDVIFKALGGGTPSTKNLKYWNGDIPWMTSVGIPEDDIYITKGERFITEEGLKNSAANVIPKGNLIIATRVGLGKAGVNTIDIAINQDLVGLIIDKKVVIPEFLAYYIRSSRTLSYITAHARGTTIKGISKQVLFNLKVPIPALKEQREIVDILDDLNKLVKNESKRKEKLESVKKGLMTLLLTGKVSVKDLPID